MTKEIEKILEGLKTALIDSGDTYQMKTNEELIKQIIDFGCGETEFHTVDIERLIRQNQVLTDFSQQQRTVKIKDGKTLSEPNKNDDKYHHTVDHTQSKMFFKDEYERDLKEYQNAETKVLEVEDYIKLEEEIEQLKKSDCYYKQIIEKLPEITEAESIGLHHKIALDLKSELNQYKEKYGELD